MKRTQIVTVLVAVAATMPDPGVATAANISLSLNLTFNTPGNLNSGGTWLVVVKADDRGMAGVSLNLTDNISFNPATGFLGPAGFETQTSANFPGRINIVDGDNPELPRTLDVGVVGGPFPTTYVDPANLAIYPGNPDLGSFTGGVRLVTGSFAPGVVPSWFAPEPTDGNVYTAASGVGTVVDANTRTTVRYNVPEPAAWMLAACIGAAALVKRRAAQER